MECLERKHSTMGHGLFTATAGAVARRTQLDLTANNLANSTTVGFRAQRVSFQEVLQDPAAPSRHVVELGRPMVSAARGAIERTGRKLDLTMQDEGFLVADNGAGGRVLLRSVTAEVGTDGSLTDAMGRRLAFAGGDARIDPASPVEIGDHGEIFQRGREVGRLLMVGVVDPRALSPVGGGGYVPNAQSGDAAPISARVVSGALERSNVNPVSNMVRMIALERDYQSLTRVITAYREADEGVITAASSRG